MRGFPKIETLFRRDEDFNCTDEVRRPVLGSITKWVVTEKVDGTNIRIIFLAPPTSDAAVTYEIKGRTDRAQIPLPLYQVLDEIAQCALSKVASLIEFHGVSSLTLYGEGYGEKIQNGGDYRKGQGFILFDVLASNKYWLSDQTVTDIAADLDIARVPIIGVMSIPEILEFVRWGFQSWVAEGNKAAEGVVARPLEPLYDSRGDRLILKLKTSDYSHPVRNVVALPERGVAVGGNNSGSIITGDVNLVAA